MDINVLTKGLQLLNGGASLLSMPKISFPTMDGASLPYMPNIPFPTMGGNVFWNNLADVNGWRVQENMLTHHCRVLNPDDVRVAWGGTDAIMKAFERLLKR
ncbi:MAG: hypothetical protein LBM16_05700 [Clostridiales bacterium]|jgi:hypothetical protein|nr:hypothetical protein [Clostridiales bacterium]